MALKTLSLDVRVGESVSISGPASVRLESKSGTSARLSVMADESVRIERAQAQPAAQQAARGVKDFNGGFAQERGAPFLQQAQERRS